MKQLLLLLLNTVTLFATLLLNYLAGSGTLNGKSIGTISGQYPTLITPASFAFSIWSLIYFLLFCFVGYQWVGYMKNRNSHAIEEAGPWFFLTNVANGAWVVAFVYERLGLSVLLIILLLFALLMLGMRLKLEVWDAPLRIIAFVWWPICIYTGWIVLASVTNVALYLKSLGWLGGPLSAEAWAVGVLAVAAAIYLLLVYARNMREAALVGVWGFVAIAFKQWEAHETIGVTALVAASLVFVAALYHGMKNKSTSPFFKWKRKE